MRSVSDPLKIMTYPYGTDNDKKRGPRWLLTHCAMCGNLLPSLQASGRRDSNICDCDEALQKARRWARRWVQQRALEAEKRDAEHLAHAARMPGPRPDPHDPVWLLGA